MVKIQACGVCHTDLHYREGGIGTTTRTSWAMRRPGSSSRWEPASRGSRRGDYVVLNWRAVCGTCRACRRGRPWYCFATYNASQKMTLKDGTELSPALGIGAFIDKTLVAAGQCTQVDAAARPAVAGLLGCGVMAGLGAAINTGQVSRGDSVAVIGCGGVGAAAIAGARLARRGQDHRHRHRRPQAGRWRGTRRDGHRELQRHRPGQAEIQALTGGFGADVVIEAVGRPETYNQAFYGRDLAGTLVLVGVPTPR